MNLRTKKIVTADLPNSPEVDGLVTPPPVITPSGRYSGLSSDKLRGGYYTPSELAGWLADWAIISKECSVCEPSCGDGSLAIAAAKRLMALDAPKKSVARLLKGIELNAGEALKTRAKLMELLGRCSPEIVETTDFFEWFERNANRKSSIKFDAVIGNPPFIRYQNFPEPARTRAMALISEFGLKPNKLTNMWVPFVVGSAEILNENGRMAFVIPAELLQVSYAAQLRKYLTSKFRSIEIVSCNELFFQGAEQEVLLLLASGAREAVVDAAQASVAFVSSETVDDVVKSKPESLFLDAEKKYVCNDSEKWLKYFLSVAEIDFMRQIKKEKVISVLSEFADIDVGVVTGKNEFFVVNKETSDNWDLGPIYRKAVGRSAHLKGAVFTEQDWENLDEMNSKVRLVDYSLKPKDKFTQLQKEYISFGEERGFNSGYKCSIRKPWYNVPSIWHPDGFAFRQIYDFPRLSVNAGHAVPTDTIHRMRVHGCGVESLVMASFTYLSGASAEIEGRSYGGGVLELEPTEAERILVPAVLEGGLELAEIDSMLREGRLNEVLEMNSKLLLQDCAGLSRSDVMRLREIWTKMRERRNSRRSKR